MNNELYSISNSFSEKIDEMDSLIESVGFHICHKRVESKRMAKVSSYESAGFSKKTVSFLKKKNIKALWTHQYNAINEFRKGNNVCITTSTSSGKTEIFQISAIELLSKNPKAKVLAVYPMKALNRQQIERWEKTGYKVGKIDGDDSDYETRLTILENSQIVVMTPDVIHAFLLSKINDIRIGSCIRTFIKEILLVVVDELHLYKGVFGTNSAYLFRRLNNIRRLLRKDDTYSQYITASATLPNAIEHSFNITGVKNFVEIGVEQDSSPIAEKKFYYVDVVNVPQNSGTDLISDLITEISKLKHTKSITFVESRQKTGEMVIQNVSQSGIYPYRAGYEKDTVDKITESLHRGDFKGVISTSALEIGIDIEGLNVAIIADMPHDKNSYQQRIGRVGRFGCDKSYVIIVRTASFASQLLFEEYEYNIDKVLPDYEPALYLEDESVQNIHALCHVGDHEFCEYKQWKGDITKKRNFSYTDCFPESFSKLCQEVLSNQTTRSFDDIVTDTPHFTYPLRYFGRQYDIVAAVGEKKYIPRERISREMVATEGYEGAVRNTMVNKESIKERIVKVENTKGEISVKREYNKFLTTKSQHRKILIPNFKKEYRNSTICYTDTKIFNLRVKEFHNIYGYSEKKNKETFYHKYEKIFQLPELVTTGTIIFHPSFNIPGVKISDIAQILFEIFLQRNAFDRNDIAHIGTKLFNSNDELRMNDKFVAIYDMSSLNITSRIVNNKLLKDLFSYLLKHKDIILPTICPNINEVTMKAIVDLCTSIIEQEPDYTFKELANERFYKQGTEVIYLKENNVIEAEDEDEIAYEKIIAIFTGKGSVETTCNLLIDGSLKFNVPIDRIENSINTEYE